MSKIAGIICLLLLIIGIYPAKAETMPQVQEIDLEKAERVTRIIPAEDSGITYQCFDVTDYEMTRPWIDENGDIAFASYTHNYELTAHLLNLQENRLLSFPTVYKGALISDIFSHDESLYWIEFMEESETWALVRQPYDGSKAQIIREMKEADDPQNVPRLTFDGRNLVWVEAYWGVNDEVINNVMTLSLEDGRIKTVGQSYIFNWETRTQVNSGYVAYLAKVDGEIEIHISDVNSLEKVHRFKLDQYVPDEISYDGEHLAFIALEDETWATGKQYIWDDKALRILVDHTHGWLHEMDNDMVLCIPAMPLENPFLYDIADRSVVELPSVYHDGKEVRLFIGSIRNDTIGFIGTYEEPDSSGANEVLVVMTLPA